MTKRDFLKRLGLLTTTAVVSPTILAEQSQVATTKITIDSTSDADYKSLGVERMRIGSYPDGSSFIIWPDTDKELRR